MMNMSKWQLKSSLQPACGFAGHFVMPLFALDPVAGKLHGKGAFVTEYKYTSLVHGGHRG